MSEGRSFPVFIVGAPRSGTKLLRTLLNNHPDVSLGAEGNFIPRLVKQFGMDARLSQPEVQGAVYEAFSRSEFYKRRVRRGIELGQDRYFGTLARLNEQRNETGRPVDWATLSELMMRPFGPRPDAPVFGDKSHGYLNDVTLLRAVFPEVRFLFIVRDPRDQALSAQTIWGRHPLRSAQLWTDAARKAEQAGFLTAGDALTVRYEDLTGDPEGELRRVCAFLGLPYHPAMAALRRPAERGRGGRELSAVTEQRAKYRTGLSRRVVARVSEVALPYLARYGYPDEGVTRHRPLRPLHLRLLGYRDGVLSLRFHVREMGLVAGSRYYLSRHLESRTGQRSLPED